MESPAESITPLLLITTRGGEEARDTRGKRGEGRIIGLFCKRDL